MSNLANTSLDMSLLASDGLVLRGTLEYARTPVWKDYPLAILAHQYPATRDSYSPLIEDLHAHGIATLAFDLRGHGRSTKTPNGSLLIDAPVGFALSDFGKAFVSSISKVGFDRIADDIVRVASWGAWQNNIDMSRLILIGSSIGGAGAVMAAPQVKGLCAIVTFCAAGVPAFGEKAAERARADVESVRVPSLFTSSEGDPFDGANNVRAWAQGLSHTTPRIVGGSAHGMAIYFDVREEVLDFLRRALK
jgi:pimeloyl-ACP methyl ester carboxylesterase